LCSPANIGVPHDPPASLHLGEWRGGGAPDIPTVAKVFHDFPPLPASLEASQREGSSNSSSTLFSVMASSSPPAHGHSLCSDTSIILRISPKSGSTTMGYIFLDIHECHHKAPISAYFTSDGPKVVPFPCPDFDAFLCNNYLCMRDVSFVGNLPHYISLWADESSKRPHPPTTQE
jgi:hypothetical protein